MIGFSCVFLLATIFYPIYRHLKYGMYSIVMFTGNIYNTKLVVQNYRKSYVDIHGSYTVYSNWGGLSRKGAFSGGEKKVYFRSNIICKNCMLGKSRH